MNVLSEHNHDLTRPLLVGLHNPLSGHPDDALVPYPPGCTGARIVEMIAAVAPGFDAEQYIEAFDRTNLWRGRLLPRGHGTTAAYRAEGERVLCEAMGRENVVLFGSRVWWSVLDRRPPERYDSLLLNGMTRFHYLPHPDDVSRIDRDRAARILLEVAGIVYQGKQP